MKLSNALVKRTLDQLEVQAVFEDTEVVPENNPAIPQLNQLFGDHTFFLDSDGLHIVEPAGAAPTGTEMGVVVKLASWRDAKRTSLKPQAPEPTDVVIALGSDALDEDEAADEDDSGEDPESAA